mgnify:CR=1 FL=1
MIYDIYYISASTKKKKNQIYGDLRVPKNYKKKKKIFSEKDNYVIIGHLNNVD